MSSLYEIDRSILECIDAETGELIDPERLEALNMERSQKIENIALWIKNLQSDALAYKAEKEAFEQREKAALKKVEQLKKYLGEALGGQAFNTNKCAISFRKSTSVEIEENAKIPKKYLAKKIEYKPDKTLIGQALKSGLRIAGCVMKTKQNIQIK